MLLFMCDYAVDYAPVMPVYACVYAPNYANYAKLGFLPDAGTIFRHNVLLRHTAE